MGEHNCNECIFFEERVGPGHGVCQFLDKIIVRVENGPCEYFVENECMCPECSNMKDEYTNSTEDVCTCGCCDDSSPDADIMESIEEASNSVIDNLSFLGDGATVRDVLHSVLGLEVELTRLKQYLLEIEDDG